MQNERARSERALRVSGAGCLIKIAQATAQTLTAYFCDISSLS